MAKKKKGLPEATGSQVDPKAKTVAAKGPAPNNYAPTSHPDDGPDISAIANHAEKSAEQKSQYAHKVSDNFEKKSKGTPISRPHVVLSALHRKTAKDMNYVATKHGMAHHAAVDKANQAKKAGNEKEAEKHLSIARQHKTRQAFWQNKAKEHLGRASKHMDNAVSATEKGRAQNTPIAQVHPATQEAVEEVLRGVLTLRTLQEADDAPDWSEKHVKTLKRIVKNASIHAQKTGSRDDHLKVVSFAGSAADGLEKIKHPSASAFRTVQKFHARRAGEADAPKLRVADPSKSKTAEDVVLRYGLAAMLEALDPSDLLTLAARTGIISRIVQEGQPSGGAPKLRVPSDLLLKQHMAHLATNDAMDSNSESDHKKAAKLHSEVGEEFHKLSQHPDTHESHRKSLQDLASSHIDTAYHHVEAGMSGAEPPAKATSKRKKKSPVAA